VFTQTTDNNNDSEAGCSDDDDDDDNQHVERQVSSSSTSSSSSSLGLLRSRRRRDVLAGVVFGVTSASASAAISASPMCGYFDEYSNGLVPSYAYTTPWNEGGVNDGTTFVRGVGDYKRSKKAGRAPVLAICNGPGISHEYFSALETLSGEVDGEREVFLYDQRGCGKSASVDAWLKDGGDLLMKYVDELRGVADALNVVREGGAHIVAHGYWGARLATAVASTTPGFAKTLTLVSPTRSRAREVEDWMRALDSGVLPSATREAIVAYERNPDASSRPEYDRCMKEFASRFIARNENACFTNAISALGATPTTLTARQVLTGNQYFTNAGTLAGDFIPTDNLGSILENNGVLAVRVVRGANDATTRESAYEIVDALNAGSKSAPGEPPFCAYDEVDRAGSCVFLDRADYFYETLNVCVEYAEQRLR